MTVANVNRAASATKLTGATFTALAIPLALFGAKPLDLSLAGTSVRGQLDDYAIEYLGAAAVVSLGFGISRLGKAGGTAQAGSASPSSMLAQPSRSASLPSAPLLTEETLKASGLHVFLDDGDAALASPAQPSLEETSSQAARLDSEHQLLPGAGKPASHSGGSHGTASQNAAATMSSSAPASRTPLADRASASVQSFAAEPIRPAADQTSAVVQASGELSQPSRPLIQAAPSAGVATDALASIVAEVQSVVEQLSAHTRNTGIRSADAPQVAASAPSQTPVQVAALPLSGASVSHHQMSGYQVNGYPTKGYFADSYEASSHKVSGSLNAPTLPAAQAYVSFARPQGTTESPAPHRFSAELAALEQVYQVREQMQQLMGQLDLVQASLERTVYPTQSLVPLRAAQAAPSYTVSAMEPVRAAVA